jgi:KUP system potassium uptake protein
MTNDSTTGDGPSQAQSARPSGFVDEAELDIADYLRGDTDDAGHHGVRQSVLALAVGAVGVVYGDIGTSPLYAFREALRPIAHDGATQADVLGLLSLLIWTLVIVVTVKYVLILLRADNRGEGGVLALYTLARLAIGRRSVPVLALAIVGAALFYGDAIITPAISVLSAVEGTELILPSLEEWVVPLTLLILFVLFVVQRQGTARIAVAFGPITVIWFLVLGGLGVVQIVQNPSVLGAFNPVWGVSFLLTHHAIAFVVMGAVFLAVTGAEALYADLGHFGRKPIILAWFCLIFPALVLNYLGQGALVLSDPTAVDNPFYRLCPPAALPALVILATLSTVIAAQAVISGAYSMTRAAMQLGLLPRMTIRHTSHGQSGQIYIGTVNWMLLFGVLWLVVAFESSEALAAAYGIAVTGTMVITTTLAVIYVVRARIVSAPVAAILSAPLLLIELGFLSANLSKVTDGGYVPLMLAFTLGTAMWAWWRGTQSVLVKSHKQLIGLDGFARSMEHSSVHVIPGTAFFLTPDPSVVPSALLHNLKHNRVLHEQNVILTVETLRVPVAKPDERATYEPLNDRFARVTLRFGFMETPNVSRAMSHARKAGLEFNVMTSSFFLGRRRPVVTGPIGLERMLDSIYALLSRFSADPSDYFHLPRDRVVELGERVAV